MDLKEKINEKVRQIEEILTRSDTCFRYCKYLNKPEDPRENSILNKYRVLDYARVSFVIILILDLCKLFIDREKYSLRRILNIVIEDYNKIKFSQEINRDELELLRDNLSLPQTKEIVNKLRSLRDNHYAHLDSTRPELNDIMPTFDEFNYLITQAGKILALLDQKLNNHSVTRFVDNMDKADNILKQLLKAENI